MKKNKLPAGYFESDFGGTMKGKGGSSDMFSIMLVHRKGNKFTKLWKPIYIGKGKTPYIKYGGKHLKVYRPKTKGFRWDTPFDYVAYK